MNLFLSTSSLSNHFLDCCTLDVSETIESDCLSVLHKLHDQVNGLQLVQVVVQPLARLFNPASLAALVANVSSSSASIVNNSNSTNASPSNVGIVSNASTPTSQNPPPIVNHDLDGMSTATASASSHSRTQSFNTAFAANTNNNNSLLSATSTYMMSPDTAQALIARLDTDRDVNWLMEIIGYGLSMPFSLTGEQDSVKDCCTIYCEWLASALLPYNEHNEDSKYQQLSKLVPVPIRKDPNRYARKMLSHLYNVFLPRQAPIVGNSTVNTHRDQQDATLAAVSRQAVLCHRVLRTIESIAQSQTNLMDSQTWDHLLALLLTVNDKLLSAPTEPDDIGTQLHDRILGVLFDLMLLASSKSIPTSSLWKTFHEMCLNWRHRPALIDHWRRVTSLLTKRIVQMPPPSIPINNRQDNEQANNRSPEQPMAVSANINLSAIEMAISNMSYENLSQTWYRFLNLIGNPVELSDPNVISRTDEFYHSACASDNVLDPRQHPCLNVLPQIFMNSMAGLRDFIESFLGYYQQVGEEHESISERYSSNLSARGSIISLSNNTSVPSTASSQTIASSQQHQQQLQPPHQHPQPQAVTPTQSRRSGIKSITVKGGKVIPFTTSSGPHASAISQPLESSQNMDQQRSGSITNSNRHQPQFMQPRPSLTSISSRTSQTPLQPQFKLFTERPKCNSLLHIFGDWLFSAALVGSDLNLEIAGANDCGVSETSAVSMSSVVSTTTEVSGHRSYSPSSIKEGRLGGQKVSSPLARAQSIASSKQHDPIASGVTAEKIMLDPPLSADSFESGQAEAMSVLCKIFSSKTSSEEISPHYLSRFYLCLQHCLNFGSGQDQRQQQSSSPSAIKRQLLASVLINSTNLLQKDLDGVNLLIPSFIKAIEFVFECSEREVPIQPPPRQHTRSGSIRHAIANSSNTVTNYDLRRACILTLLNLLAYPFHFQDLPIRNCLNETSASTTFKSIRSRLLKLLFVALQTETDSTNMQILFGGLSLAIHDLASNMLKSFKEETATTRQKKDSTSSNNYESFHSSLDGSNRLQDDTTSQSSFVFNSSGGFLTKSLHVTCHLLINIWKHDTQVSLAAMEVLTTIARVSTSSCCLDENTDQLCSGSKSSSRIADNNNRIEMKNEYKQTTKWICDYICNQCSRPPPAHSRDMHSTIVAAYQCLSVWFYNHPYLLNDESCVNTLMEVIELGVSGQKSKSTSVNSATGLTTNNIIKKSDKIMKPSSMRVREAAESLLNTCMVKARSIDKLQKTMSSSYDTVLDEHAIAELFGGVQYKTNVRQVQNVELRKNEAYKLFKYFSDEDSVIFGLLEGLNHDSSTKDSVICLLRTPFGKHCWKMKFNYYTEKSREKIIANKTLGLIKRPFQQSTTPTSDPRMFSFPGGHNKSLYFNNSAKFFPETIENLTPSDLDQLVLTLHDYIGSQAKDSRLKNDLDKIAKIFSHQILAEQKVIGECSIRIKRVDCEEPQPIGDLDAARVIVTHLGLKSSLISLENGDRISESFVNDLKSLDHQSVRTCDLVNIFYVRKYRTSPKEILESVRERHNVSLSFFEWILELGQPTVVRNHSRWTGKVASSWNNRAILSGKDQWDNSDVLSKNQMMASNHGGAIFDGDRMTLYWSDMCQELAFLVPHKIERMSSATAANPSTPSDQMKHSRSGDSEYAINISSSSPGSQSSGLEANSTELQFRTKDNLSSSAYQDQSSDDHSLCSVTSDTSSQSTRAASQQGSLKEQSSSLNKDQKDNVSLSRQSITTQKRKTTNASLTVGCDTNIIICWLECPDDIHHIPCDTLLSIAETGSLLEDGTSSASQQAPSADTTSGQLQSVQTRPRLRDYAKYFISPMKNGLYRVNLMTSFGRQWLALPLVDGMTVSKGMLSSLIRESVLNLCRRRRLDADSYQPPHVKRRLRIQEICNNYKISSRYESTEFYNNLFRSKLAT